MIVKRFDYGGPRAPLRNSCFEHVAAKDVARNSDHEPQQERNAPTPGVETTSVEFRLSVVGRGAWFIETQIPSIAS
jgi:hypothetical protein